jgi:hypothetical protein
VLLPHLVRLQAGSGFELLTWDSICSECAARIFAVALTGNDAADKGMLLCT